MVTQKKKKLFPLHMTKHRKSLLRSMIRLFCECPHYEIDHNITISLAGILLEFYTTLWFKIYWVENDLVLFKASFKKKIQNFIAKSFANLTFFRFSNKNDLKFSVNLGLFFIRFFYPICAYIWVICSNKLPFL